MKIHSRILLTSLLPTLIIAAVLASYFSKTRIDDLSAALLERGHAIANQLAPASEYGVFSGNQDILNKLIKAGLQEADVVRITILDSNHRILAQGRSGDQNELQGADLLEFEARIESRSLAVNDFEGLADASDPRTIGWVRVELSNSATRERQQQVLRTSGLITLSVLIIAILFALRVSRSVADPILKLTGAVQQLGAGDLEARVQEKSTGEMGMLEHGINQMAATLQTAQSDLQAQVDTATAELRETLEAVEISNVELDLARKRALQASRVKSEFLANMSHEIRTPMNGLLGFIDLLLRTPLDAEQRDYTSTIRKSATNLLVIVNDILDFSKIESGKLTVESSPFDLREALEDSVDLMAPVAHGKGLELILLIYSDVPLELYGDSNRIRQVLLNLLGNALKFTNQGSVVVRVMLDGDNDEMHHDNKHTSLRISVTDTGIGLSEMQQSGLFNAFNQADNSATRRFSGTGLGLFISRKLVELMGGHIGVESTPGTGSTFWFTLHCPRMNDAPDTDHETIPALHSRALVYDAHPLARLAYRHTLESLGLQVTEIGDCDSLRAAAGKTVDYDLLVLGVNITPEEEPKLQACIRDLKGERNQPLLVLLNSIEHERLTRVLTLGADACLSKPPRRDQLRRTVCKLLGIDIEDNESFTERRKQPRPRMPNLRGARILLADDNEINRKLVSVQLESLGVEVCTANDGQQALTQANQHGYDLILMDLHMPELSGEQVALQIRSGFGPNQRTPIVALTANAFTNESQRLSNSGINECLIKPISEYQLWQAVKRWTGHKIMAPVKPEQDSVRESLAKELFGMLIAELPVQRAQLDTAFRASDWTTLRELAHKLRGSAAYCQSPSLEQAATELERISQTAAHAGIETALLNCLKVIDKLLEKNAAREI